jgi:ribosome-binding factor A
VSTGRAQRVAESIRAELAEIVRREVKDPRVHGAGLLTVTHVECTHDISLARIMVSFIPQSGKRTSVSPRAAVEALEGLNRAAGYLRGEIGRRLSLRHAPELRFLPDKSSDWVSKLDSILAEDKMKADEAAAADTAPAVPAPDGEDT